MQFLERGCFAGEAGEAAVHAERRILADDARQPAVGGSFVAPAHRVPLVLVNSELCQRGAIQDVGVARESSQENRIVGSDFVERIARDFDIVKTLRSDRGLDDGSLRACGDLGRKRIANFGPRGVLSFRSEIDCVRGCHIVAEMVVRVVDPGNHDAAAEIDPPRARSSERLNFARISGSNDSFAANRQRLDVRMRGVAGENLAVEENRIGSRLLRDGRREEHREKRREAGNDQERASVELHGCSPWTRDSRRGAPAAGEIRAGAL